MAQHHAYYRCVRDGEFELKRSSGRRKIEFKSPSYWVRSKEEPLILAYKMRTTDDDMGYTIWVNDTPVVYDESLVSNRNPVGLWEVFTLDKGTPESVSFQVIEGDGYVKFSDVLIWFTRH